MLRHPGARGNAVRAHIGSAFVPLLFVLLWSTGFIGAKFGLPYAEPMTFISLRFAIVCVVLALWTGLRGAAWLKASQLIHLAVAGILVHAGFMGATFAAIDNGVEAGTAALIAGLQPILTAILARPFLNERTTSSQWFGLLLGLGGVLLVVEEKLGLGIGSSSGVALCLLALLSLTIGTVWQKKFCSQAPIGTGNLVQFATALLVTWTLAMLMEERNIRWTAEFTFALVWLVGAISIGAVALFYAMLRRGEASRVAAILFLAPASTAVIGWAVFGEGLSPRAILGMLLATLGIAMASRKPD